MLLWQDHPSSDSFYDSDFADGEVSGAPQDKYEKTEQERHEEQESAEVDGEWGRHDTCNALQTVTNLKNNNFAIIWVYISSRCIYQGTFSAMLEQERQRIEQLTAGWDDPTRVDWGNEESGEADTHTSLERTPSVTLKCTALYSYTVSRIFITFTVYFIYRYLYLHHLTFILTPFSFSFFFFSFFSLFTIHHSSSSSSPHSSSSSSSLHSFFLIHNPHSSSSLPSSLSSPFSPPPSSSSRCPQLSSFLRTPTNFFFLTFLLESISTYSFHINIVLLHYLH